MLGFLSISLTNSSTGIEIDSSSGRKKVQREEVGEGSRRACTTCRSESQLYKLETAGASIPQCLGSYPYKSMKGEEFNVE
jgi:hypothetical protein